MFLKLFDYKQKLQKESTDNLFSLYTQKKRINLKPQIYAGQLLFNRGYDRAALIKTKEELIAALMLAFDNKYELDPKKRRIEIKRNIIRLAIIKFIVLLVPIYFLLEPRTYYLLLMSAIYVVGEVFRYKRSVNLGIAKADHAKLQLQHDIETIKTELQFSSQAQTK